MSRVFSRSKVLAIALALFAIVCLAYATIEYRARNRPLFCDFIKDGDSLIGLFLPWYENEPVRSSDWIGFFDLGRNMIVVFNADEHVGWSKLRNRRSRFDVEFSPADNQPFRVFPAKSVLLIKFPGQPPVTMPLCEGGANKLYFKLLAKARDELDLPQMVLSATEQGEEKVSADGKGDKSNGTN